jgi:hypothetical protein
MCSPNALLLNSLFVNYFIINIRSNLLHITIYKKYNMASYNIFIKNLDRPFGKYIQMKVFNYMNIVYQYEYLYI